MLCLLGLALRRLFDRNKQPSPRRGSPAVVLGAVLGAELVAVRGAVRSWARRPRTGCRPTRRRLTNRPTGGPCPCLACCASVLACMGVAVRDRPILEQLGVAVRGQQSHGAAFTVRCAVAWRGAPGGGGVLGRCGDWLLFGRRGLGRALLWGGDGVHRGGRCGRCFAGLTCREGPEQGKAGFAELPLQLGHLLRPQTAKR